MKKEKWIEEVMETARQVKPVEANPFMASKVQARLQNEEAPAAFIPLRWVYLSAAAMLLIIVVNVGIWRNSSNTRDTGLQQIVQEYGWGKQDFYSVNYSK